GQDWSSTRPRTTTNCPAGSVQADEAPATTNQAGEVVERRIRSARFGRNRHRLSTHIGGDASTGAFPYQRLQGVVGGHCHIEDGDVGLPAGGESTDAFGMVQAEGVRAPTGGSPK